MQGRRDGETQGWRDAGTQGWREGAPARRRPYCLIPAADLQLLTTHIRSLHRPLSVARSRHLPPAILRFPQSLP